MSQALKVQCWLALPAQGLALVVSAVLGYSCAPIGAQQSSQGSPPQERTNAPLRLLVKPKPGADLKALTALHATKGVKVKKQYPAMGNLQVVEVKPGTDLKKLIADYKASGLVEYAEPDHDVHHFEKAK